MNTTNNQQQNFVEESEIDIMAIIALLWKKRKFVIRVTCVFAVLGLFIAIFSPKVYTSSCTFVPQTTKKTNSSVSSLAALAGINLNNMTFRVHHGMAKKRPEGHAVCCPQAR